MLPSPRPILPIISIPTLYKSHLCLPPSILVCIHTSVTSHYPSLLLCTPPLSTHHTPLSSHAHRPSPPITPLSPPMHTAPLHPSHPSLLPCTPPLSSHAYRPSPPMHTTSLFSHVFRTISSPYMIAMRNGLEMKSTTVGMAMHPFWYAHISSCFYYIFFLYVSMRLICIVVQ